MYGENEGGYFGFWDDGDPGPKVTFHPKIEVGESAYFGIRESGKGNFSFYTIIGVRENIDPVRLEAARQKVRELTADEELIGGLNPELWPSEDSLVATTLEYMDIAMLYNLSVGTRSTLEGNVEAYLEAISFFSKVEGEVLVWLANQKEVRLAAATLLTERSQQLAARPQDKNKNWDTFLRRQSHTMLEFALELRRLSRKIQVQNS